MKLLDLFEAIGNLAPVQRIEHPEMGPANISKLRDKIWKFRHVITDANSLKQQFPMDSKLNSALDDLIKRANMKISYIERMNDRLGGYNSNIRKIC